MITNIENTKLEVLTGRIINGLTFCNTTWQHMRLVSDNAAEYQRLSNLLDSSVKRLHSLIHVAKLYGLNKCVFGKCKWDDDSFICFGCTEVTLL